MSELPNGWAVTYLGELFEFKYGKGLVQENRIANGSINVYGSSGIVGKHNEAITNGATIIVGRKGSVGAVSFSPEKCWAIDTTYFIDGFSCEMPPEFWMYYIQALRLGQQDKSSAIPGISREDIYKTEIVLPPLNEQRRIVAKLEKLLSKVEACQKRIDKIPTILKRFRQSVLAAACSGRLTANWREMNSDAKPYELPKDSQIKEHNNEYPLTWGLTELGSLTSLVTSGSRGWAEYYSDKGSIFIRAQNINSDYLNLDDVAYVDLPVVTEGRRTKVYQYDLLITITGANVTKTALVDRLLNDAYVSQHVALVRLVDPQLSKFVHYWLISIEKGRRQLLDAAYGAGKPGLNLDNIRNVFIAIPPLAEQQEIARRVEELFKYADQHEARYKKAKDYVDKLTQSILAKAFRGELVPQDPNDEPASVLLERIKAERTTTGSTSRAKRNGAKPQRKLFE